MSKDHDHNNNRPYTDHWTNMTPDERKFEKEHGGDGCGLLILIVIVVWVAGILGSCMNMLK